MSAPTPPPVEPGWIARAFTQAVRETDSVQALLERCRSALVLRYGSDGIWLVRGGLTGGGRPPAPDAEAVVTVPMVDGPIAVTATPAVAPRLRRDAGLLAQGLMMAFELRELLHDRQRALDDAVFQLRALRQVTRLLSSVHSVVGTERLILDFLTEVFGATWGRLYRPDGGHYAVAAADGTDVTGEPSRVDRGTLDALLPLTAGPVAAGAPALVHLGPDTGLALPLDAGDERLGLLALGPRASGAAYGRTELELAITLGFAGSLALLNAELIDRLHSDATTDELTGLLNRRALEDRLEGELGRIGRHAAVRTSVVLLDLDGFKEVNDSLGHAAGDHLLVHFARILRTQSRQLDVVGRLGGDEFVVVLPMTTAEEAGHFVRRVQRSLAAFVAAHPDYQGASTCMGVAEAPRHGSTLGAILAAADAALYAAKRAGGGSAVVAAG